MMRVSNTRYQKSKANQIQPVAVVMFFRANANLVTAKFLAQAAPLSILSVPAWYLMKEPVLHILCMEMNERQKEDEDHGE